MLKNIINNKGFTLIELMIGMAISSIVMAGVYAAYLSQSKSYNTQELTVDMQANLRTALELIQMDLRLAGSDISANADAGFLTAASNSVSFSMDITGGEKDGVDNDGDELVDEGGNGKDDDDDGLTDEPDEAEWYDGDTDDENEAIGWSITGTTLYRSPNANDLNPRKIPVAQNIQQLNLVYFDQDGNRLDDDGAGTVTNNIDKIRSVQVTLIATAGEGNMNLMTFKYPDNKTYQNQMGEVILDMSLAPDDVRRRMVSSEVYCRNMN